MKIPGLRSFLFVVLLSCALTPLVGAADEAPPPRDARPTLFVCGDSTAAQNRLPLEGWGAEIGAFFDPAKLHVANHARAGRSARTFLAEGLWEAVRSQLRPGDFVLIQFGHNDGKSAMSLERYDLSGTGDERQTIADARTGQPLELRTFGYYLRQMVNEAKAAGAFPIVLSSVPRARWHDAKIVRGEEEHARWAADVARASGVPYVDANALIAAVYDALPEPRLKALYFPQDNTHTNPAGARLNAACIVTGLAQVEQAALNGALRPGALDDARRTIKAVAEAAAAVRLAVPLDRAFPAPGAAAVCPDTPLRLTFTAAPQLGRSGRIRIVDTATGQDADTIDLAAATATQTIGGEPNYRYYPVTVAGNEVTIHPRNGALSYQRTYAVVMDAGVFQVGTEALAALAATDGWTFRTKPAAPPAGSTRLVVAADGTGDFCTVQGAVDFVPDGNTTPTTIFIRKGTYTEIVFFANKHALTFLGEDRAQTVIAYATNDRFNPTSGNPFGTAHPDPSAAPRRSGRIYHRGVFLAHRANDLVLSHLTIRNTTPQGGSQAEAVILNGTPTARAILHDVDLYSYQDTLQINGQAYLTGCYIEGDVDFMWGTGPCYFEKSTCRALRSGAYYTQIRNPGTNHGYVYVGCTFDGIQGVMGNYLSRIGTGRFPHSEVVLIDCTLTAAVAPVAWQFMGGREGKENDAAEAHFWEFNSRDPAGRPVDMTFRLPGSRRLEPPADDAIVAQYRDPGFVLGGSWDPRAALQARLEAARSAPDAASAAAATAASLAITVQPQHQLALLGTDAVLTVAAHATAGGRLSYQWHKDGHPLNGATSPRLRLPRVSWSDAGVYAVTIRNSAGELTSATARLTPVAAQAAQPPALPQIPEAEFDVTAFAAAGDGTTDNTAAFQRAIDTAIAAGGGTVIVPAAPKPYLCGPLQLGNNLALEIEFGATVRLLHYSATPKAGAYPLAGDSHPDFITAKGAHDIVLTGGGTLDGDGEPWWDAFRANKAMPHRPFLVRLNKCERVLVAGLTFTRSPMFHVAMSADHLTVFGITVATPDGPNTDGVDPAGSHHLIQNCAISCGDDNIVMKPGGTYCSDITIADCAFGEGHGLSVGGQTNRGLDGMVVKNCSFDGTTSGLRLKADPTQGGEVKNITYTNLTMQRVVYPIVFYSYYKNVGNPASIRGSNQTTPEKVQAWNAKPPLSLASQTLPSWKKITVANVFSAQTSGYSILWGLPLEGYLMAAVKLADVRIAGGPGFEIYNATDVQFTGSTDVGAVRTANALVIVRQPVAQHAVAGGSATFTVTTAGPAAAGGGEWSYAWNANGRPLADGALPDGTTVAGAHSATLTLAQVTSAAAGKYSVTVTGKLDGFDPGRQTPAPASVPATATSNEATLTVE